MGCDWAKLLYLGVCVEGPATATTASSHAPYAEAAQPPVMFWLARLGPGRAHRPRTPPLGINAFPRERALNGAPNLHAAWHDH